VASLSQGRTAAAQCGLFTYKSVPVIFEPPCISNSFCILRRSSQPHQQSLASESTSSYTEKTRKLLLFEINIQHSFGAVPLLPMLN